MQIPSSVQLLGVTVRIIEWPETERTSKKDKKTLGLSVHSTKTIYLASTCRGKEVPQSVKEHTFFHELLHQVLDSAGYHEQSSDEQFVDLVSGLLHQGLGPHMK